MTAFGLPGRLAVLAWHKIGPVPEDLGSWLHVPVDVFVRQIDTLLALGWDVVDARTLVEGLSGVRSLPTRAAVLTFDDACESLLLSACPLLSERRLPAVCFTPTAHVGGWNVWDADREPPERVCTWEQLRLLDAAGISVQSHGHRHTWLSLLSVEEQREEMRHSKREIERILGTRVDLFAYPYSDAGTDLKGMAQRLSEAGYRAAFLCGGRPSTTHLPCPSPFGIPRIAMHPGTDLALELAEPDGSPADRPPPPAR